MSLTYDKVDNLNPIARVVNENNKTSKFLYLDPEGKSTPINTFDENIRDNDFLSSKNGMLNPTIQKLIFESVRKGYTDEEVRKIAQKQYDRIESKRNDAIGTDIQLGTGEFMVMMPTVETERIFMAGRSGSGKSTLTARYANEYKRMFPKNDIIMFTVHDSDPAYAGIDIKKVMLDEKLINPKVTVVTDPKTGAETLIDDSITLEMLSNSLVIFDDSDSLENKQISKYVTGLVNNIINNGRHYGIHCIYLAHMLMNYAATRLILAEANKVVFFINGPSFQNDNFLKKYASMDKYGIEKVNNLKSRWAAYFMTSRPTMMLHEHGAFIIRNRSIN